MAKFKTSGSLDISGQPLQWWIRHFGGASNAYEGLRGLSVSICADSGRTRELVIEFPFADYLFEAPSSNPEFVARLRGLVAAAIEAGWKPLSRGRAFHYSVAEK